MPKMPRFQAKKEELSFPVASSKTLKMTGKAPKKMKKCKGKKAKGC